MNSYRNRRCMRDKENEKSHEKIKIKSFANFRMTDYYLNMFHDRLVKQHWVQTLRTSVLGMKLTDLETITGLIHRWRNVWPFSNYISEKHKPDFWEENVNSCWFVSAGIINSFVLWLPREVGEVLAIREMTYSYWLSGAGSSLMVT